MNNALNKGWPYGAKSQGIYLVSDNWTQPTSRTFGEFYKNLEIEQVFTTYNNPKGNANAERYFRTAKEEILFSYEHYKKGGGKMFEGEMVRLREYHKEDVSTVWKFVNDPEIKSSLVPGIPFPWKLEEEEKWYEEQNAKGDTYNFAIEKKADGTYIGGCGINKVDWKNSVATVGIFLGKEFLSQGYGTDAMKVLVRFVFNQMNIHKVILHVFSFNKRAIRSYEKVGFKIEGTLRAQIFRDGKYYDEIIMGILREEMSDE